MYMYSVQKPPKLQNHTHSGLPEQALRHTCNWWVWFGWSMCPLLLFFLPSSKQDLHIVGLKIHVYEPVCVRGYMEYLHVTHTYIPAHFQRETTTVAMHGQEVYRLADPC